MTAVQTDKLRNVVLVGHGGSGKTTLAEVALHVAGATSRVGRVEDGTTVSDFDPAEKTRGSSLSLAVLPFEWKGHKVNLIDTPGEPDFVGEVHAAMRVADMAVFVVSAVAGVEVGTEAAWRQAVELDLPRMVFINKLDRERADFTATLDDLRNRFGAGVAPLELPVGEEHGFRGVADLLSDTAWIYDAGVATHTEVPDDMADLEHQVHDNLVEGIVVADEALMARYLDGDIPSIEELERTMALGVDDATVFPVVCGSALKEIGIDRLLDFICEIGPSPLDRPPVEVEAGGTVVGVSPDPAADPLVFVFKTLADQFVGHVNVFRVLSGTVRADDHLVNSRSGTDERLHGLFNLRGSEHQVVSDVVAGDIAAVAKLAGTTTGDTLSVKGRPVRVQGFDPPQPSLGIGISARTQADEDKMAEALHRLLDEDPALAVLRRSDTNQTVLYGIGEAHLSLALDRLENRFGVHVDIEPVRIGYRETISGEAAVEGRHKKQSGGHGQFGVCNVVARPLERGGGFRFVDRIVGGAISRGYIPAVEKGIEEAMATGGCYGFPVVDLEIELVDGKEHSVDSSEMAFKTAGRLALRAALDQAGSTVLEPIDRVNVVMPTDLQGEVLGDLNARRGRVQSTDARPDGDHEIVALVPAAEMTRYAVDLRAITGGRGRFTATHDHYDLLPANLLGQVTTSV
ncbi:MAG: elongation factor G [Microthrixaceae bacterium]|jgi:elongation factor G|nr:elongation factor G [Microthrixaceae bacterium]